MSRRGRPRAFWFVVVVGVMSLFADMTYEGARSVNGQFLLTGSQKFTLMTSDGAAGVVELIPGPAFNLLEVNFQTDPRANKIRSGNFILVKK